jgi:hypothetical protein
VFTKIGLAIKIGIGYGVMVVIAALVGYMGWNGINQLYGSLSGYSFWVELDTILHAEITANVTKVPNKITIYTSAPSKERHDELDNSLTRIDNSILKWGSRVKGNAELEKVVANSRKHIVEIRDALHEYQNFFDSLQLGNTFEASTRMKLPFKPICWP